MHEFTLLARDLATGVAHLDNTPTAAPPHGPSHGAHSHGRSHRHSRPSERYGPLPPEVTLIDIPLDEGYFVTLWYLAPSSEVDAAAARLGWTVRRVALDDSCPRG